MLFQSNQSHCRKVKYKKPLFGKFVQFENGSNKVIIELRVVQFWSDQIERARALVRF